jgi:hypothetical protein
MINGVLTDIPFDAIFADDGTTPLTLAQQAVSGRTFSEDDVARIRQEEKDKLYSQIARNNEELTALREQVGSLTAAEQRREAQLKEEQERLEAEARRKEEEDLDARSLVERKSQEWQQSLDQVNSQWEQKFNESEQQRLAAEALAQREREFGELRDYTLAAVEANKENIAPQLLGWISGNSKEEVDAAIQRAIDTTNQIMEEVQQVVGQPQQQPFVVDQQPQPPVLPGTRATAGPANSDPAGQTQQLTAEQIQNMSIDQYAALRQKMGIGGQGQNRGLFG